LSTLGVWVAKPGHRGRPHAPGRGPKQQTPGAMAGRGHNMQTPDTGCGQPWALGADPRAWLQPQGA